MNTPTRRMKANPKGTPYHQQADHIQMFTCANHFCLPVDAPVEPRTRQVWQCPRCHAAYYDLEALPEPGVCLECKVTLEEKVMQVATPPPASAPEGTPVERWLTYDEIFDIAYPTLAEVKVRRIIERLCALLDEKEAGKSDDIKLIDDLGKQVVEQRTRAEKAETLFRSKTEQNDRNLAALVKTEADLAAAREREAKLREAGHEFWFAWSLGWDCSHSPGHPLVHDAADKFMAVLDETNKSRAALAATKEGA